ncbi:MAG: hypothetical protein RRC34_08030 [Lentisphaeria bacterium]|nr:hypothetical protein [Lentisphaeria bacterium]
MKRSTSMLILLLLSRIVVPGLADDAARIRWGVDDAGTTGRLLTHPKSRELFREFGFNFWVMHYASRPEIEQNLNYIRSVDTWCQEANVRWVANLEGPNFIKEFTDEEGRSWYNRPDGRHFHLFPDELLEAFGKSKQLWGLMYDEAAHMQNCRNKIAGLDAPWIFDPEGHTLESAAEGFTEAVREIERLHARYGMLSVSVSEAVSAESTAKLPQAADATNQTRYIDIHFHADARSENGGELPKVAAWMKTNNVKQLIIMQYERTLPRNEEEERQIIKNFAAYKGTLYRFCVLMPEDVSSKAEAVEWLEKEKESGAIGFGEHYGKGLNFDDPANMRLYAACAEVGLPVLFHMDGNRQGKALQTECCGPFQA